MENFTPIPAFSGGLLIGIAVVLFLAFNGRMAGVSGIMHGLLTARGAELAWRVCFLVGLVFGALIFNAIDPDAYQLRIDYPYALLAIGGFLVGFGTRMGSGCTSGHGICGIANGSLRSIVATLVFMGGGIVTVFLIRHVFGMTS